MVQLPHARSIASGVVPRSIRSSVGCSVSGNIRPLMLSTLVAIGALYLVLDASAEPRSVVSPAERSAVERTLSKRAKGDDRVEQVIVTAPRINEPKFDLDAPQIEIALSLQPPQVKIERPELKRQP